jgi:GAF domain-containing protein
LTSGVGAPIITEGRVWGAITVLGSGPPLPASAEARLAMFAKLVATAISHAQARTNLAVLADEQTALRRVAELVARRVGREELFDTVAVEASKLIDDEATTLVRVDDRAYAVVAACGGPAQVGTRTEVAPEDEGIIPEILRTRSPARLDDYWTKSGPAHARDDYGVGSSVGVPIIVDDRVWGILAATTEGRCLPARAEPRLAQFAELVAAALANAHMREEVQQLADEQAALRRVAELVGRGMAPHEVFAAVATEASRLLDGEAMTLTRFEGERELVVVAACRGPAPVGTRITFEVQTLPDCQSRDARTRERRRRRPARLADGPCGPHRQPGRDVGPLAAGGARVRVRGQRRGPDPPGTTTLGGARGRGPQ